MRSLVAVLLVAVLVGAAHAQSFDESLATCNACHGEKGVSETPEVPSLAGMPANATVIQLFLFRSGMRKIEIMNDVAKGMSDADLTRFGEHFEKLAPRKATEAPDPAIAERARALVARHRCASCHNPDFSGREQMPRLAAQREDYLLKSMRDYKALRRPGYEPTMDDVMRPISDADIVDLAHYLARLP
jgi:cytochrome c553